jgi:two-component system, LytTR family, sensor kinase
MNSNLVSGPSLTTGDPAAEIVQRGRDALAAPFRRTELQFIWGFWAFIAMLTFANSLINNAMSAGAPRLPSAAPFFTALINCLIWGALTPLMFRLTSRQSLDRPKWVASLIWLLALGIVIAVCVAQFMSYLRYWQAVYYYQAAGSSAHPASVDPEAVLRQFWFMKEFVIYLVVLAGGFAHDYFVRYRIRHEQAGALEAQAARFRSELADARLSALRQQLNPHFLFNTLNAVSSLVERDPRGARRMIAHLSDLLRDTLEQTELEVTLDRELTMVRRYIEIMQTRFGGKLETAEDVAPDTLRAMVPTLLLQPLVENAIKHGVERIDGTGRIEIRARRSGDSLLLSVLNSGADMSGNMLHDEHAGAGVGLQNTRDRLAQSYGERQSLVLSRHPGGGAAVEIVLPFHTTSLGLERCL